MLNILENIESAMPNLLSDREAWKSLFIDYEFPYVERLYREIEFLDTEYKVYLHRIHPANANDVFYHPHPWPSIVRVLDGTYEMGIGYGDSFEFQPPIIAKMIVAPGIYYEMKHPHGWHYVKPLEPVMSLMISGPKFSDSKIVKVPEINEEMSSLPKENIDWILDFATDIYGALH